MAVMPGTEGLTQLEELGYQYVPGPSGDRSDWLLRQVKDPEKGFEWQGQEAYDKLGSAVFTHLQAGLGGCGLDRVCLQGGAEVWVTPGLAEAGDRPLALFICGSAPGGAAAVWGRSLCINQSTREGAMFDFVHRAQQRGWSVVVANPNLSEMTERTIPGSECGHLHLCSLWRELIAPTTGPVLTVAHSYGASQVMYLLKAEAEVAKRTAGLVLTDGWCPKGSASLLQEGRPRPDAKEEDRAELEETVKLAPLAAEEPSEEVLRFLGTLCRDYVASELPAGTLIDAQRADGILALSAGHKSHPATTAAAAEELWKYLDEAAAGTAAQSNARVRQAAPPSGS